MSDPETALQAVRRGALDALITDMRMPGMGGAKLIHEIRRIDPDLPAIVVTAFTGESELLEARREGVLAVLPKPVPVDLLISLVHSARRGGVVALIEDDPALADNLQEALRGQGFTACTAGSATESERLFLLHPFAALVDLRLPDAPAGEVVKRLRHDSPHLPIIVVTGHPESLPTEFQPEMVFIKPFATQKLMQKVEELYQARSQSC
jgi:DNA-binding NtrC family response regulator